MAALLVRDPHLEVCPDFESEPFEPMRALMRNTGLTDEQAVEALREAWVTRNNQLRDRWVQEAEARAAEAEAAAQQQQQEEEERLRREQMEMQQQQEQEQRPDDQQVDEGRLGTAGEEQRRTKLKLRSFDPNLSVASVIVPRPSSYAINKLANFEYCELWYFTQEGCEDAQRSQRSEADDAFGMARMGEMVMLRPVAAVQASKRVVQDADLTWEQFHYAQRSFVEYVLKAGWPEDHAQSLVRFFVHLENSPYINRENGRRILLTYQARVRRNWMDVMKQSEGAVFNIALINDDLMEAIARDLQSVATADLHRQLSANHSVCLFFLPFPPPSPPSLRSLRMLQSHPNSIPILNQLPLPYTDRTSTNCYTIRASSTPHQLPHPSHRITRCSPPIPSSPLSPHPITCFTTAACFSRHKHRADAYRVALCTSTCHTLSPLPLHASLHLPPSPHGTGSSPMSPYRHTHSAPCRMLLHATPYAPATVCSAPSPWHWRTHRAPILPVYFPFCRANSLYATPPASCIYAA
ncbi:hypothetical protein D9615_004780 [Tricholomella constricta]|uniref:Uncharacterized protein n=1 Tax=Tricholomella constricta TaxID=117010 RepID=A0A8H5HGQ0_9AGAR|nr:hypothetical protein D9615_004780 [Tricholomella constricta]